MELKAYICQYTDGSCDHDCHMLKRVEDMAWRFECLLDTAKQADAKQLGELQPTDKCPGWCTITFEETKREVHTNGLKL